MKTLKIKKYHFESLLGKIEANDALIVVEDGSVTSSTFEQKKHEHILDSNEIARLSLEIAKDFFSKNYQGIIRGDRGLSNKEVSGIRAVLGLTATELALLLGIDKGTMSKILHGKFKMKRPECILAMERLLDELGSPGYAKHLLSRKPIKSGRNRITDILIAESYKSAS